MIIIKGQPEEKGRQRLNDIHHAEFGKEHYESLIWFLDGVFVRFSSFLGNFADFATPLISVVIRAGILNILCARRERLSHSSSTQNMQA